MTPTRRARTLPLGVALSLVLGGACAPQDDADKTETPPGTGVGEGEGEGEIEEILGEGEGEGEGQSGGEGEGEWRDGALGPTDPCTPGEREPCECPDATAPERVCADGLGWTSCGCPPVDVPLHEGEGEGEGDGPPDDPGPDDPPGGRGVGTCQGLLRCVDVCTQDCPQSCYADAGPDAWDLYQAMLACWGRLCAALVGDSEAFSECTRTQCGDETRACQGDAGGEGEGE